MILLRKSVWPLREVVSSLQRDELLFAGGGAAPFLKDLYDHVIQVLDTVETFRDIVAGMLDIYLSAMSNKMNEVMKVLTIFAVIFIPLTFIAGIYGMNFNPEISPFNMPELNWIYGYPFALGLMVTVAGSMFIYFKKKKWF
jgi:magnesium transporter